MGYGKKDGWSGILKIVEIVAVLRQARQAKIEKNTNFADHVLQDRVRYQAEFYFIDTMTKGLKSDRSRTLKFC